jgi:hypothetical protein
MAKTKISEFSSTASNNTDIDGISIAEGMAPSNVNNAIRELMSQLKDWQSGSVSQDMYVNGAFTATGNAVLSADLSVGDDLTVTGDATVGGGFTCTGAAVLSSNLSVAGTLSATGATSLGAITCSGAAVLSSTLAVDGATNLKSGVTLGTSTSNTVTLNALLSASGGTGTSGQYLKSNGTASAPSWGTITNISSGTAQATTTGTAINFLLSDFVSDPSAVKRITVVISGVSTSGTSNLLIQLGTSSGYATSGYVSTASNQSGSALASSTAGFLVTTSLDAADIVFGTSTINLLGSNDWVQNGLVRLDTNAIRYSGGGVTLAGSADRIRITAVNGTDTFDAGSINVLCE